MTPEFVIRPATPADALCIAVLGIQVFLDTYATRGIWPSLAREALGDFSVEAIGFQLEQPDCFFLVAGQGDRLVGFAQLSQPAHEKPEGAFYISRLYVQERFTGKGIGKALLSRSEALAREKGAAFISLAAWAENARAREFYERQGYDDVGPSTFTFEDQSYDTRRFLKQLSPQAG
jgi:ribosomal protein S18 acetylase RimI-like enzyme